MFTHLCLKKHKNMWKDQNGHMQSLGWQPMGLVSDFVICKEEKS